MTDLNPGALILAKPIKEIKIHADRQRRQFDQDAIDELAQSIQKFGLFHPIILTNDLQYLQSGERRLRAVTLLIEQSKMYYCNGMAVPSGCIPCITLADLPPEKLKEAELEENLRRVNLTVAEEAAAVAQLHKFRLAQAEGGPTKWTMGDTSQEVYDTPNKRASVRDSIIISQHLDDPEVAQAKTPREAIAHISKKLEREFTEMLGESVQLNETTDNRLIEGSTFDYYQEGPALPGFDVIIADPPYGVGADGWGSNRQHAQVQEFDDSESAFVKWINFLAYAGIDLCKEQAHLYIFCDIRQFGFILSLTEDAGWNPWATPLIWAKGNQGMLPDPDGGPRRTYEAIFFAKKGKMPVTGVYPDVISSVPAPLNKRHPDEKPAALYANLLRRSCLPGMTVLDPCCGSGGIFPAANSLSLTAYGIEQNSSYAKLAASRLTEKLDANPD